MGKTKYDEFFGNFLSNTHITVERLLSFGDDASGRMAADNGDGRFTTVLNNILNSGNALRSMISDSDVALALQKGATLTTDKVMAGFKSTMSTSEDGISYSLGGKSTPAYLEFYPNGMSEYSNAAKEDMFTLTDRVFKAADKYKSSLPADIHDKLVVFKAGWADAHTDQEQKKGTVTDSRSDEEKLRTNYEEDLLASMHLVGQLYPGNVERGKQYFNFSILYAKSKHAHQSVSGALAPQEKKVVLNRVFNTVAKLTVSNTDDNASFILWFGANENEDAPENAIEINVGENKDLKPQEMGNSRARPLLILKNLSEINVCDYSLETVG